MTFTGFLKQFMHNVMMNYGGVRENTSFFLLFYPAFSISDRVSRGVIC